jgi:hypothetical protein
MSAMISSEVERTLVKSPPELWTELSNPDALARHLGEFGEIRITRVEPERAVEWEAGDTAGTVRIKPSGWGTKVTLTATKEVAAPAPAEAQPVPEAAPEPAPDPVADPVADMTIELESEASPEPAPSVAAKTIVEPAPMPDERRARAEPPRGFFSRLFGGRRKRKAAEERGGHATAPQQPDPFAAVRKALSPETLTAADPFSMPSTVDARAPDKREIQIETPPDQAADISADLKAAEEVAADEVTSVLTSVLDRLGAAHHRPFSRA